MPNFRYISPDYFPSDFDCGVRELNHYFHFLSLQNHRRKLGSTTLLLNDEEKDILGFYTLCVCHIERYDLPKKFGGNLPNQVPAIKLARLAVDKKWKGQGYGEILLAHSLRRCLALSHEFGGYLVLIDAKPEAEGFYSKYGIRPIRSLESAFLMGIRVKDISRHFPESLKVEEVVSNST